MAISSFFVRITDSGIKDLNPLLNNLLQIQGEGKSLKCTKVIDRGYMTDLAINHPDGYELLITIPTTYIKYVFSGSKNGDVGFKYLIDLEKSKTQFEEV